MAADAVAGLDESVLLVTVWRSLAGIDGEVLPMLLLFCWSFDDATVDDEGNCPRSDLAGSGFSGWNSSLISWRSLLVSFSLVRSCSMFCNASGSSGVTRVFGLTKKFLLLLGFGLVICKSKVLSQILDPRYATTVYRKKFCFDVFHRHRLLIHFSIHFNSV